MPLAIMERRRRQMCVIPTLYDGVRFRSRLEARWAMCLSELGIHWDYEPEGYAMADVAYLPDFWLPQVKMFAEVKPNDDRMVVALESAALEKAITLTQATSRPLLVLDGPPRVTNYWVVWPDATDPVGWDWFDVNLFDFNQYHLTEGRFYMDTGTTTFPYHCLKEDLGNNTEHPAVLAVRAARFGR